ncbi:Hypothetical protein A7982_09570 [Minicystis rosea]|nr:Hypothetical protein A7982_09570 [Minicystis rosea]
MLEGLSDVELVRRGAEVGTPRLVKELARNYGVFADWLPNATPEQLRLLGFVDVDWLRIAIWCGRQAESLHEQHLAGASRGAGGKQVREATAGEVERRARAAVARLRTTLRHLSGGLVAWTTRIDVAAATAVGVSHTADALAALCDVGEAMLNDTSAGMGARRAKSKLDAETLAQHRALAKELAQAVKDAAAVKNASVVLQSDVDLWDGMAITLFEQLVEAVEAAREEDLRIPAPSIIGLRSWFRRGGTTSADKADPNAKPAPASAGG